MRRGQAVSVWLLGFSQLLWGYAALDVRHSPATSEDFGSRPVVVFTVYWDFSSTKNLVATPIAVYERGRFREPPCTRNEPDVVEFVQKYLARGRTLYVLDGGRIIGNATVTTTAQPEEDYCFGVVVQVDMAPEVADVIAERRRQLLAVTQMPSQQQGPAPRPVNTLLSEEAKRLARNSLLGNGATEKNVAIIKTEAWTVDLNGDGVEELVITSHASVEEVSTEEDLYSLFLIAQKTERGYQPVFTEYQRTQNEAHLCSIHFIDTLNFFPTAAIPRIFVQYRCYEGVAYGVYDAEGPRLYTGAYYGI